MANVDLIWQLPETLFNKQYTIPPTHNGATSTTTSRKQPVAASQQRGHYFVARPQDKDVEAQGRIHKLTDYDDDPGDSLPSIEELLDPLSRKENVATGRQGTRDRPVILEEDEGDTPDPTTDSEANSTSVNAGSVPAFERSQRAEPCNREPLRDVEEGCFVYEDLHPFPPLNHEALASTPAQDHSPSRRHSHGVSQEHTKPHGDNRPTRRASEESAAQSLIATLDQDGEVEEEENDSDLERDMQLAFKEQEESTLPGSPGRRSFESSYRPINQDLDPSWSEELRYSSRLCSQEKEGEKEGPNKQEREELAADEIRQKVLGHETEQDLEADDDDNSERIEQRGELQQDGGIETGIYHSESNGYSHDTNDDDNDENDEDDEEDREDENPRPTKKQRLSPAPPDIPPTPLLQQSSPELHSLARAHSATLSSARRFEIGIAQSETDLAYPPTSLDEDHHFTPPGSHSPSYTQKSASAAEYQEWPFQGFLKRVTIGNQITYNLEFSLSHIPEHINHFNLSLHPEALSPSSRESSAEDTVSHRAFTSRKLGKEITKSQEIRLAEMVKQDKTWAEIGRKFPGHTLQSLKENFKKQGGKPRKRGRKAGVRIVRV